MENIIINPNIEDLSILEELGFEKRYSEFTGELIFYYDAINNIEVYIENKSINIGFTQYSTDKKNQTIQILKMYEKGIIIIEKEGDE